LIREDLLKNAGITFNPDLAAKIDVELKEFEAGWEGTKIVQFQNWEAYMDCYLDNGIYEIRYLLKEARVKSEPEEGCCKATVSKIKNNPFLRKH